MRCEQGDLAIILNALRSSNIGKTVIVDEYIGYFEQGEQFPFNGVMCQVPITDHYWWVASDAIVNMSGDTPKAYVPDTWLEPIRPSKMPSITTTEQDLEKSV